MKYTDLDFGTVEAVFNRLGGMKGAKAFLRAKNPWKFARNEHGHPIFSITGVERAGVEEVKRLKTAGFRFDGGAEFDLLHNKHKRGKNRIVNGGQYNVVLMPTWAFEGHDCTFRNLLCHGFRAYGYRALPCDVAPCLLEAISHDGMIALGLERIAVSRDLIGDEYDGEADWSDLETVPSSSWSGRDYRRPFFTLSSEKGEALLSRYFISPDIGWDGPRAIAFLA